MSLDFARDARAATLVELVIVLIVSGILFVTTPVLIFHGVKTLVFLPKALAVARIAPATSAVLLAIPLPTGSGLSISR